MIIEVYGVIVCFILFLFTVYFIATSSDSPSNCEMTLSLLALITSSFGIVFCALGWMI